MKQRIVAVILAFLIGVIGSGWSDFDVSAEAVGENLDFSYLLTDETLVGYMASQTWGIYLAEGNSYINKMSSTKIGAGGSTNAALRCKVSVTSIVERQTTTGWARVTSWTQTNENALSAVLSKSLTVGTGYYYRVRSTHYASTDVSNSNTSALWMGN